MICPICKTENNEDSKFCIECGKKIPRCPTCNKVITEKSRFCIHCGTPLPEDVISVFSNPAEKMPAASKQARPEAAPQKKKKKVNIIPVLCALLLVVVIGAAGFFLLSDTIDLGMLWQSAEEDDPAQEVDDEDDDRGRADDEDEDDEDSEKESDDEDEDEPDQETGEEPADTTGESTEDTTTPDSGVPAPEGNTGDAPSEETTQGTAQMDPLEYFILNCDKEYFTKDYFDLFDAQMCRIARNGIYARMGRKFQDETLMNYFLAFDWYVPTIDPEDFSESMLNEYQIANRDLIVEFETERGYR